MGCRMTTLFVLLAGFLDKNILNVTNPGVLMFVYGLTFFFANFG